jgi:hypothetical protein
MPRRFSPLLVLAHVAVGVYRADIDFGDEASLSAFNRTDFCGIVDKLRSGEVQLTQALQGYHVTFAAAVDPTTKDWFYESEDHEMSGLHVQLLEVLAKKGEFTFDVVSHPISAFEPGMGWTEYYATATKYFDAALSQGMVTVSKANRGLVTPYPFVDMSIIAVQYADSSPPSLLTMWGLDNDTFFKFASPLSNELWGAFFLVTLATSAAYYWVERIADKGDPFPKFKTIYEGLTTFTGTGNFEPRSRGGKLMSFSYAFVVLVLVSSYTANLAVVLVKSELQTPCSTFTECVAPGTETTVCVVQGTTQEEWVLDEYAYLEKEGRVVRTAAELTGLKNQECDIALVTQDIVDVAMVSKAYNEDCTLTQFDNRLVFIGGGWMTASSYEGKCRNVMRDSLNALMTSLSHTGDIEKLYKSRIDEARTQDTCTGEIAEEDVSLPISSMSGLFVLHFVSILIALIWRSTKKGKQKDAAPAADKGAASRPLLQGEGEPASGAAGEDGKEEAAQSPGDVSVSHSISHAVFGSAEDVEKEYADSDDEVNDKLEQAEKERKHMEKLIERNNEVLGKKIDEVKDLIAGLKK